MLAAEQEDDARRRRRGSASESASPILADGESRTRRTRGRRGTGGVGGGSHDRRRAGRDGEGDGLVRRGRPRWRCRSRCLCPRRATCVALVGSRVVARAGRGRPARAAVHEGARAEQVSIRVPDDRLVHRSSSTRRASGCCRDRRASSRTCAQRWRRPRRRSADSPHTLKKRERTASARDALEHAEARRAGRAGDAMRQGAGVAGELPKREDGDLGRASSRRCATRRRSGWSTRSRGQVDWAVKRKAAGVTNPFGSVFINPTTRAQCQKFGAMLTEGWARRTASISTKLKQVREEADKAAGERGDAEVRRLQQAAEDAQRADGRRRRRGRASLADTIAEDLGRMDSLYSSDCSSKSSQQGMETARALAAELLGSLDGERELGAGADDDVDVLAGGRAGDDVGTLAHALAWRCPQGWGQPGGRARRWWGGRSARRRSRRRPRSRYRRRGAS